MLSVLDPHSTYFDPIEYASFRTEQRSEYFGIGATIEDLREGKDVTVLLATQGRDDPEGQDGPHRYPCGAPHGSIDMRNDWGGGNAPGFVDVGEQVRRAQRLNQALRVRRGRKRLDR